MPGTLNNERGATLIIVLSLMVMLAGAAIMSVDRSTTDVELSFNQLHEEKAFYAAEAGARKAFLKLDEDLTWRTGYANEQIGDGEYTVTIIDSSTNASLGDTILIQSEGLLDEARVTVEVTVVPDVIKPFKKAMFAKSHIEVKNSFCTDSYNSDSGSYAATYLDSMGDLGTNGTITIKNNADIGGSVATSTAGGLEINNGASITGDTTSTAPETTIPVIDNSTYDQAESNNDNLSGISGTYSYSSTDYSFTATKTVTFTTGTYYFESFILKNSAEVIIPPGDEVTIYVRGDIEIKNSGEVNAGGDPADFMIYSTGDMVLKNSADFFGIIYAPNAFVDLRNSGDFYGSVVANDILNHNSACFHYDRNLGSIEWSGGSGVQQVAWRETF